VPTPLGRRLLKAETGWAFAGDPFPRRLLAYEPRLFRSIPARYLPLTQAGVILWSLSASAHDWPPREMLTRLCTTPVIGVLESHWDFGSIQCYTGKLSGNRGAGKPRPQSVSPGCPTDKWTISAALKGVVRLQGATLAAVEICRDHRVCMTPRWRGVDSNFWFRNSHHAA
jgi:hypothetical protein